jgi:hypothetical protein
MNESKILDGIRESVKLYYKRNLNMYTRATIINTVFSRKVVVCCFGRRFHKDLS